MVKIPSEKISFNDVVSYAYSDQRVLVVPKVLLNSYLKELINPNYIFYNDNQDEDMSYKYKVCYSWSGNEILYETLDYFLDGIDEVYSNDTADNSDYILIKNN